MEQVDELSWAADVIVSSKLKPVVVKFGAKWCEPCKAMEHAYSSLEAEMSDKMTFLTVEVDEMSEGIVEAYTVFSLPSFLVFQGGGEVARSCGAQPKAKLGAFLLGSIK